LVPPSLLALSRAGLVVGFAAGGHIGGPALVRGVAGVAAALFVAVAALSVWRGDTVALWCLRLPAGAAIGLAALVALPVGWATPRWSSWAVAVCALSVSAVGYLTLEALAHGAPRRAAVTRALAVAMLGLAHGVAVAAILFAAVIPAVAPDLAATLATLSGRAAAGDLLLAAGAGLATGAFLQVLWDDRPVTYPLTHLPWRGRERA
ncbi:MAG TPA: hypothetical protein VFX70_00525, partial [Mycobacteriales bacterium]|nr:hypothetical protein [Mycobacteriales bacterium]